MKHYVMYAANLPLVCKFLGAVSQQYAKSMQRGSCFPWLQGKERNTVPAISGDTRHQMNNLGMDEVVWYDILGATLDTFRILISGYEISNSAYDFF